MISCLELPAVQDKPQAVLDGAHVAARRAVRAAARRPATWTSRSSSSSSTRRTCSSTAPPRRSSSPSPRRAADPLEGGRRLLRDPGARRRAGRGARTARQPRAARAARLHADDAKALKAAASTYPTSDFYDVEELLTSMGIGEAAVTILSEDGVPTPVVHTRLRAPASRMGPADDVEGTAEGVAAVREVRHARRGRERAREAGGAARAAPERARRGGASGSAPRRQREPRQAPARTAGLEPARRLPELARGQGAAEEGHARRVRDAAKRL